MGSGDRAVDCQGIRRAAGAPGPLEREGRSMNALATSRLAHWWVQSLNAATLSRPARQPHNKRAIVLPAVREQRSAAGAVRPMGAVQRWLERMAQPDEPQNATELLAYARSIERDMPGLAADLRFAALRHSDTPTQE
jgi:hypothetical protein